MNVPATSWEIQRFKTAVTRHLGLQFDETRFDALAELLRRRVDRAGCPGTTYLTRLESDPAFDELKALAEALTVTETYFFRNHQQFDALAEIVLPERMDHLRAPTALRLLSAGCASGEEAYSLSVTAQETILDPAWSVQVRAVDMNAAALEKAVAGHYSAWSLRETEPAVIRRWFRQDGRLVTIHDAARANVTFEFKNIASPDPDLWQPGLYDAIFCRNVLMYFSADQMRAAIARIEKALAPGGFLFLGHAESLRDISDGFHVRNTHATFYYQRKDGGTARARRVAAAIPPPSDEWVEAIRAASVRVAALGTKDAEIPPSAVARIGWNSVQALELLHRERFSEALDLVPDGDSDADALLLRTVLLVNSGRNAEAETACFSLLKMDDQNSGAHYVLALCREHEGDLQGAADHDRVAIRLDPVFAMPRLHLGLMARRTGNRDTARRELTQALILLKNENSSRVLLFGGGFSRDALIALCDAALKDEGGRA